MGHPLTYGVPMRASVLDLIGNTPLVRLARLPKAGPAMVLCKLESMNPSGSLKDRVALAIIEDAEARGVLKKGGAIVEPTGGNTGVSLALVGAVKGYQVILVMPEDVSPAHRAHVERFGAKVVLTSSMSGMAGAVAAVAKLKKEHPDHFWPKVFENPATVEAHKQHTAREIIEATDGKVDAFVMGVGTGGTITGVGQALKERRRSTLVVAVEPLGSPMLSQGRAGRHSIPGIGADFVPPILDRSVIDEVMTVSDEDAHRMAQELALREGLYLGPSSGANVFVALKVAERLGAGKTVVTVGCDSADRYLRS